jgi:hypothetical protein
MNSIPTFVINLKNRTDRKEHILNEFSGRDEFNVAIIEPQKDENPVLSLWQTIKHIIENMIDDKDEFFLWCEDDHQFTEHYQKDNFLDCLKLAAKMDIDVLSGGVSAVYDFVQVDPNLFWMGTFSGSQFIVIFKRLYSSITGASFEKNDTADLKIAKLTENKFFVYPFISVQKDFGYSDVTPSNNLEGRVDAFFKEVSANIKIVKDVALFYKSQKNEIASTFNINDYHNINVPTYIINLPEREDRLIHIKSQFVDKNEFDIKFVKAIKHKKGNLGLWLTIRKIVEQAIINEDDIIIICEDDHEFTPHYSKNKFIKNVIEGHLLGAGILLGGVSKYGFATLATNDLFWVDRFFSTQFTVIYKTLFQRILDESFDDNVVADGVFSQITSNKLVAFPFVSTQKIIGHSDISPGSFKEGQMDDMFQSAQARLSALLEATKKYSFAN